MKKSANTPAAEDFAALCGRVWDILVPARASYPAERLTPRAVTERAVTAVRDTALPRSEAARTGRSLIAELPGFRTGDALASAVLTAAAPQRMAIYDRRVQHALDALGLTLTPVPGRYGRYLQILDDLLQHRGAHADGWTARDLDTALYGEAVNHVGQLLQDATDHDPSGASASLRHPL
ncbi:hypothetical protein ABZS99_47015 [Streptomyces sp. NPDC005463]|uniref:hypothetical protein n=1 Tax=Streptomyces sp. NPDC005463 TaxID=3154465 RepID=UPI0033BB1F7D